MKINLVVHDWLGKDHASVYNSEPSLSDGDFHSGTSFPAEIELDDHNAAELKEALERGFRLVFWTAPQKGTP